MKKGDNLENKTTNDLGANMKDNAYPFFFSQLSAKAWKELTLTEQRVLRYLHNCSIAHDAGTFHYGKIQIPDHYEEIEVIGIPFVRLRHKNIGGAIWFTNIRKWMRHHLKYEDGQINRGLRGLRRKGVISLASFEGKEKWYSVNYAKQPDYFVNTLPQNFMMATAFMDFRLIKSSASPHMQLRVYSGPGIMPKIPM